MSGPAVDDIAAVLARYDILDTPSEDPAVRDLAGVCALAASISGAPHAVVNLLDDDTQHQVAAFGFEPRPSRRDDSLCATTLAAGVDVYLRDASRDPRYARSPFVDGRRADIRFYSSTILRTSEDVAIGTLCVFGPRPHELTDAQRHSLRLLADQALDVLELRRRTRELEAANEELGRSQERLAAFAGQISHDLKAPITAIIGFTELLEEIDPVAADPSAAAYVARCSSASRRMLSMIDDLLAFARIGGTMTPRPQSLDAVLPSVLADLGAAASGAAITWSGPDVRADPTQFRALLQNLIGNALAYSGVEGGVDGGDPVVEIRAEIDGAGTDAGTVLRVIDHGPGIPADRREEALRPLARLRKDVPGAGLGLAVCARVLAAHDGTLELEHTPGGGLTVVARFPA